MGFSDYQQVTSIKCPIRIVGPDAECPIRIVFCPISIVPLPNFTRIFAADSATWQSPETSLLCARLQKVILQQAQQREAKPETGLLCARLQKVILQQARQREAEPETGLLCARLQKVILQQTRQRGAEPETSLLCARLQKCWRNQKHDAL